MNLDRRTKIRLALFAAIALGAAAVMIFRYIDVPAMVFGAGHYNVTVELTRAGGLYPSANVSYRGTVVGRVESVELTDTGVQAVLSLQSAYKIPSQLRAEVHSQSAIGEQYVDLQPSASDVPALKNGDVIPAADTAVPPDIDSLLDATNRGLTAIPQDNLKTAIDESYTAIGGLGPELTRLVKGSTDLSIDADKNLDSLITLIDQSQPVLDSQTNSAEAIDAWAAHLAIDHTSTGRHRRLPRWGSAKRPRGRRRGAPTIPAAPTHTAVIAGQPGQHRPGRRRIPTRHRAVAGAIPASRRQHTGNDDREPKHQTGLQGPVPRLQPQSQPAARLQHRIPAPTTTTSAQSPGLPGPTRR